MNQSTRHANLVIVSLGVFLIISLALFAGLLLNNYEVVDKGKLLDYTEGLIYEIRIFDRYTFYIEPERRLDGDVFNSFLLTGIAFISLTYAFLIAQYTEVNFKNKMFVMYLILFFGMIFLAIDEFFGIHESLGHNMQFLANLPFIKRPDDAIILSYLIPVSFFLYYFRHELMSNAGTIKAIGGVIFFLVISTLSDIFTLPQVIHPGPSLISQIEEVSEIIASILLVIAFLLLGSGHIKKISHGE